ncbi:MAG: WG repeat-containing protein [Bacteroidota bacterium]
MLLKEEIASVFKQYLQALFTQDYVAVYEMLYSPDVSHYHQTIVDFAHQMDEYGEAEDFLQQLGIPTLSELDAMSSQDLITAILKLSTQAIAPKYLKRMLAETAITDIVETPQCSEVHYEYPVLFFDEWQSISGQIQMVKTDGQWKLFFKSGLETGLRQFQSHIDEYIQRKQRDQPENIGFEGDLNRFSITGYRDFASGKVVFEPRFKDAGDFNDGLAYVQIMTKYGYIDLKGELVIKPKFLAVGDFSEGMAAVQLPDKKLRMWGFINTQGKMVIAPAYQETSDFSEGLCAVKLDGKWGYIDKTGKLIIPAKFDSAEDFSEGYAYVDIYTEDGEQVEMVVDDTGKIERLT